MTRTTHEQHGHARAGKESREYRAWQSMITRCHNKKRPAYKDYGGRGIFVCKRWRNSFRVFLQDVGKKPNANHSLERINNNRGYEPGNVRWATRAEQSRNTQRNRIVVIDGLEMTIADAATIYGISHSLLSSRLNRKWELERALNTPARRGKTPGVERFDRPGAKPFSARIMFAGKRVRLGNFATAKEAQAAYQRAKRRAAK